MPPRFALQSVLPRHAARRPDFSLAMVNIVLLLVLFFLVVGTPADQAERQVDLPETRDLPLDALPRPLLLLDAGGGLVLDGQITTRDALYAAIAAGAGPDRVHLLAARDHPAQAVLALSAGLRAAGAEVLLVTLRQPLTGGAAP